MSKSEYDTVTDTDEGGAPEETFRSETDGSSTPEGTTAASTSLSKDLVFEVLKNRRRRLVIQFLRDREVATLSDVAEHVAAVENGKEVGRLTPSERKRVYVGLYQCHLPRLADAGIVEYDAERKTVELRERASLLYPYLDLDHRGGSNRNGSDGGRLRNWCSWLRSLLDRR